mgnify:CR=1 FL=1
MLFHCYVYDVSAIMNNLFFMSLLVISSIGFFLAVIFPVYVFIMRRFVHDNDKVREKYSFGFLPSDIALYGMNVAIGAAAIAGLIHAVSVDEQVHRPYLQIASPTVEL